MAPIVKVCGITRAEDAQVAAACGATHIGCVVDHPASPRSVARERARSLFRTVTISTVAVIVNPSLGDVARIVEETETQVVQLHGDEPPDLVAIIKSTDDSLTVWKALPLGEDVSRESWVQCAEDFADAGADALLVDARIVRRGRTIYGGTGRSIDWARVAECVCISPLPIILAGGLNGDNVAQAITATGVAGVDAASTLECRPGQKDHDRVQVYVREARAAFRCEP